MMTNSFEVYPFESVSVPFILFQGQSNARKMKLEFVFSL